MGVQKSQSTRTDAFIEQIKDASRLGKKVNLKNISEIVICGMGGSAIAGTVLSDYAKGKLALPLLVAQETLPKFVRDTTLVFVISYSGNTQETQALYKAARKKTKNIIIITSGGELGKQEASQVISIPQGFQPRDAFAYLFFPLLKCLGLSFPKRELYATLRSIDMKSVRDVARAAKRKIPLIYGPSSQYQGVVYRWQTQCNENAKLIAHSTTFPEANHNEVEAMDATEYAPILLKETDEFMPAETFLKPTIVRLKGKSLFSRMIYGIHFGDLVSFELAHLLKRNRQVAHIDFVKEYYARKKKRK